MALLSKDAQDEVVQLLLDEGLVDPGDVEKASDEIRKTGQPILAVLTTKESCNMLQR